MEIKNRKSISDKLQKYCYFSNKDEDFIEVTSWSNGEGIDVTIHSGEIITIWTNIKACCNDNEFILLCVRSSMGRKDICLANDIGVIDGDYYSNPDNDGNIGVALKNRGSKDFVIHKNDKIAQILFMPYLKVDNEETVTGVRGGGYGSTTK